MAPRVLVALKVECNCQKPIENARVHVEINNSTTKDTSKHEAEFNGSTDDDGVFVAAYERDAAHGVDLKQTEGFVIACGEKKPLKGLRPDSSIDPAKVLESMGSSPAVQRLTNLLSSENLAVHVYRGKVEIDCHENCRSPDPSEHDPADYEETTRDYEVEVDSSFVDETGWNDSREFTCCVENNSNVTWSDILICFPPTADVPDKGDYIHPKKENAGAPTPTKSKVTVKKMPKGWGMTTKEKCIQFFATGDHGIPPGGSECFKFKVPEDFGNGLVDPFDYSYWKEPDDPDEEGKHVPSGNGTETPGPLGLAQPGLLDWALAKIRTYLS